MNIPQTWTLTQLGNLTAQIVGGGTPSKTSAANFNGHIPFMTVKDLKARFVNTTVDHISEEALQSSATTKVPADTLIVATRMSLGKIARPTMDVAINQDLKALFLHGGVNKTFVEYFWRSKSQAIQSMGTGTTVKGIRLEDIRSLEVPLAPVAEQKRIADKLDTVLTRVDAVNTRLARVAPLLKRFRQSVLAAATSGRLTEDWRGGRAVNETWRVIPLGKYVENHDGARVPISETLRTERRGAYPYYGASGVIDTIDGFTHEGKFVLIGEDGANLVTRSKPIAFIATGKIWVNNHAHVLKCKEGASDEYLAYYINSIDLTPYVSGSAQPKLNQKNLNTIPVPVPPTEEQTEIVRRVETLFAFADRLEARLAQAQTAATRLTPALLAKAFRGELVPQDPNDEPAAELLRRLQAERATAPKASAGRGRKAVVQSEG